MVHSGASASIPTVRPSGPAAYTEADLREAFKAGWKERNRVPGLKRVRRNSMNNAILGAIGGDRYAEHILIKDDRAYSHSFWLRSAFRKALTAREDTHAETGG